MQSIISISSPPATTQLTTLANAKLDLNVTYSEDDAYVTFLITRASAVITSWIGRDLGKQTLTQTFRQAYGQYLYNPYPPTYGAQQSGSHVRPLILTFAPVISVTSITEDGGSPLTQNTDFEVEPTTGLVWRMTSGVRWQWSASSTVVSYQSGYVLPLDGGTRNLPVEIEDVALAMVRSAYYSRGQDPSVILELTEGLGRTAYNKTSTSVAPMALDAGMKQILAPYRSIIW